MRLSKMPWKRAGMPISGWKDLVLDLTAGAQAAMWIREEEAMCPQHQGTLTVPSNHPHDVLHTTW